MHFAQNSRIKTVFDTEPLLSVSLRISLFLFFSMYIVLFGPLSLFHLNRFQSPPLHEIERISEIVSMWIDSSCDPFCIIRSHRLNFRMLLKIDRERDEWREIFDLTEFFGVVVCWWYTFFYFSFCCLWFAARAESYCLEF